MSFEIRTDFFGSSPLDLPQGKLGVRGCEKNGSQRMGILRLTWKNWLKMVACDGWGAGRGVFWTGPDTDWWSIVRPE